MDDLKVGDTVIVFDDQWDNDWKWVRDRIVKVTNNLFRMESGRRFTKDGAQYGGFNTPDGRFECRVKLLTDRSDREMEDFMEEHRLRKKIQRALSRTPLSVLREIDKLIPPPTH